MASNSGIQWTDATWNCLAGCEAISPGCAHCYAATMTRRLEAMGQKDYAGLTTDKHFNGTVRCLPDKLDIPLKWRKPRRVFVNSMSDLFHEDVPDEFIDKVFAVMALSCRHRSYFGTSGHTFQVLTKRAKRMHAYLTDGAVRQRIAAAARDVGRRHSLTYHAKGNWRNEVAHAVEGCGSFWPLEGVWLGVSCEDQQRADERIPWLLKTPAEVRFVSAEPLLGDIDIQRSCDQILRVGVPDFYPQIHWIIVGGESGRGARPCDVSWIRSIVEQCKASDVPCFVKQLGVLPVAQGASRGTYRETDNLRELGRMKDPKGGDPAEWPKDLRVRQFPLFGDKA